MVLDELRADCDLVDDQAELIHHAAGARHLPPKDIPADVLAPAVLEDSSKVPADTGGTVE